MSTVLLENIIPIALMDNSVFINKEGDIVFCFSMEGPEMLTSTKEKFLSLNDGFEQGMEFLGSGYVLHYQDYCLESKYYPAQVESVENDFINNTFFSYHSGKQYWKKLSYLFVIKVNGNGELRNYSKPLLNFSYGVKPKTSNIDSVRSEVLTFVNHLKTVGINLSPLLENGVYNLYRGFLGGFEEGVFNDINFADDKIVIGNGKYLSCLAVNSDECLPQTLVPYTTNKTFSFDESKLHSDFINSIGYGIKCNHVVNTIIHLCDQSVQKDKLEKQSKKLNSLSLLGKENTRMKEDNDRFITATYEGKGKLIVAAHMNVIFWADSKELLEKASNDFKSAFKTVKVDPHVSDYLNQKKLFLNSQPGNGASMPAEEFFLTHSHIAASLVGKESVIDRTKKTTHSALVVTDRVLNVPMFRDSWDEPYRTKKITARNSAAIGATGGGKTVGVINELYQYYLNGFFINCMDVGRSLEVICRYVGGNYIIYEEGMSLGINPFALLDNILKNSILEFQATLLGILWKPGYELNETERAALEEVLIAAYSATKNAEDLYYVAGIDATDYSFPKFYEWLSNNQEKVKGITKNNASFFDVDSFLLTTKQFYNGKFSNLFSIGKNKVDLLDINNRFTVWELDNVVDHPTLFPIFAMLITYLTTEVMWNRKGINKFFWIEEAWKIAKKKGMASYFIYLLKTIRKFDGGFGVSIQEIGDMDVEGSRLMEVFMSNVDVWNFTYHKASMAEATARKLRWITDDKPTDLRYELLKSIRNDLTYKYPYMEKLSIIGNDAKVVRIMLSPEQVAAFMSDMNDKAKLFPFIERNGGNYLKGISEYVTAKKNKFV